MARASMRPTPEGVGNIPRASALFGASAASMRPTPEGVGNDPTADADSAELIGLQ